jgi:hypothetical protein
VTTRSGWRTVSDLCSGIILLVLSLACLLPIAFIGDPTSEAGYRSQTVAIGVVLLVSCLFGSIAMAVLIKSYQTIFQRSSGSRLKNVVRGIVLILASVVLFWLSFVQIRSSDLLLSFPLCILMLYAGGAFILLSFRRAVSSR